MSNSGRIGTASDEPQGVVTISARLSAWHCRREHGPLVIALVDVRSWKSCLPGASKLPDAAENLRKRDPGDREALALSHAVHPPAVGADPR